MTQSLRALLDVYREQWRRAACSNGEAKAGQDFADAVEEMIRDAGPAERQIVQRGAGMDKTNYDAWRWAHAAAGLGWRVVAVGIDNMGHWYVMAEAPIDADPNDWDRAVSP